MRIQIFIKDKKIWLQLWEKKCLVTEKEVDGKFFSENLLKELDKLLKENKIEKKQLKGVDVVSEDGDSGSAKLARIVSLAGNYCLTKEKKLLN